MTTPVRHPHSDAAMPITETHSQIPLTVLVTCKNERRNIIDCLTSAQSIANEFLIGDSGSTDGTLELLHEFMRRVPGCRLIHREYVNSGNFKNWCIPQAKHPWVFIMDADERLDARMVESIRRFVELNDPTCDGYWARRLNYFQGRKIRYGDWGSDRVIRLIRRDVARYREYTDHSEIELPAERVGVLNGWLAHHSFSDFARYLQKLRHYARQQAELWQAQGRKPSTYKLVTHGAARFLRSYLIRGGFLDGMAGYQLAIHTAYYSFLKQAELWTLHYQARQDARVDHFVHSASAKTGPQSSDQQGQTRAA